MSQDKQKFLDAFGLTSETYEKSKDILPTFDLGKLSDGSIVILKFLDDLPKEIEVKNKFAKKGDSKTIISRVIPVNVDTVFNMTKDGIKEIPYNQDCSLWLSSKSLSIGVAKIAENHNDSLKGVKVKISIGMAEYKLGLNRCYTVSEAV